MITPAKHMPEIMPATIPIKLFSPKFNCDAIPAGSTINRMPATDNNNATTPVRLTFSFRNTGESSVTYIGAV